MKITFILIIILLFCQPLLARHKNIQMSFGTYESETSIAINPNDPNQMIAGSNLNYYFYSNDGGRSWQSAKLSSSFGVWGDPTILWDYKGNAYFFHLSSNPSTDAWLDRIVCQKTTDKGLSWNDGSFMGLNGTKDQDKQWGAIDSATNNIYMAWTEFDSYGINSPQFRSRMMFARSTDLGVSWSTGIQISDSIGDCIDDDYTVEGANVDIGLNGEVYITWMYGEELFFDKSTDLGLTWLPSDKIVSDVIGGWNISIPGLNRANGFPVISVDRSNGTNRGTIYISFADQRNGSDDTDIWLIKSNDGGDSWTQPVRVNDDPPGKQQFLHWMALDNSNGNLYFVFYDRRNYDNNLTDVYLAVSTNGGSSFRNEKISETPFLPVNTVFFGDYTGISSVNNVVRPIWMRMSTGGEMTVWTSLVDVDSLFVTADEESGFRIFAESELEQNYPNPFDDATYIAFKLRRPEYVNLEIYDITGKCVAMLMNNQLCETGRHVAAFDRKIYGSQPGFYYYRLRYGDSSIIKKMLIIN
jgi:hypothetical protein